MDDLAKSSATVSRHSQLWSHSSSPFTRGRKQCKKVSKSATTAFFRYSLFLKASNNTNDYFLFEEDYQWLTKHSVKGSELARQDQLHVLLTPGFSRSHITNCNQLDWTASQFCFILTPLSFLYSLILKIMFTSSSQV